MSVFRRLPDAFVRSVPFVLVLATLGCASLPVSGPLPLGVAVTPVATVGFPAPFSVTGPSLKLALVDNGVRVIDLATGHAISFGEQVTAVQWSPDGSRLVIAALDGSDTVVRIVDGEGKVVGDTRVSGKVTTVAWRSAGEVVLSCISVKRYTFGASVRGDLYRWDGTGKPEGVKLLDLTVTPVHLHAVMQAPTLLSFSVSPLGDEIVYASLVSPPMYAPYLKVVLRHLETGAEKELGTATLAAGGAVFAADGERVIVADGEGTCHSLDPWGGGKSPLYTPCNSLALSSGNRFAFVDGRLLRNGLQLVAFPAGATGAFAPAGGGLVVRHEWKFYLVSGLDEPPVAAVPPAERQRLLTLRRWRAEGLISNKDYLSAKERLSSP